MLTYRQNKVGILTGFQNKLQPEFWMNINKLIIYVHLTSI